MRTDGQAYAPTPVTANVAAALRTPVPGPRRAGRRGGRVGRHCPSASPSAGWGASPSIGSDHPASDAPGSPGSGPVSPTVGAVARVRALARVRAVAEVEHLGRDGEELERLVDEASAASSTTVPGAR